MNLSARFTEFALTGALFWIGQFIFFGFGYEQQLTTTPPAWMAVYSSYDAVLPEAIKDSIGIMLSAFGLIGIFVTGLIMDMFSVYFTQISAIPAGR